MTDYLPSPTIFTQLNIRPVINACGIYTDLGGSILSPGVWRAMDEVNSSFVSMVELLDASGSLLADLIGTEAARVTAGASAAITLGIAACMSGMDQNVWQQLPDTTGLRNEVIIQRGHRYKYDRMVSIAGAKLIEVGDRGQTTVDQIEVALGPKTGALMFPGHLNQKPGTVPLSTVIQLAHRYDIPVLVDAAYLCYPTEIMHTFSDEGADLICFSAKYFWGPNSGGFICGRQHFVDAVAGIDFTRFESGNSRTFGRPFKLDRTTIVATVVALQEWLKMDHGKRWARYATKAETLVAQLIGHPNVTLSLRHFTMDERLEQTPINCVVIEFDPLSHHSAESVLWSLQNGTPSIRAIVLDAALVIVMETLLDGQEYIVAERLSQVLGV